MTREILQPARNLTVPNQAMGKRITLEPEPTDPSATVLVWARQRSAEEKPVVLARTCPRGNGTKAWLAAWRAGLLSRCQFFRKRDQISHRKILTGVINIPQTHVCTLTYSCVHTHTHTHTIYVRLRTYIHTLRNVTRITNMLQKVYKCLSRRKTKIETIKNTDNTD